MGDDELLEEQRAFYRARAPEYDEWWQPDLHLRRLNDGSRYKVVKVMYEPDELAALIEAEGWDAAIDATRWFIFGSAQPR